jgi:hypothetical protein
VTEFLTEKLISFQYIGRLFSQSIMNQIYGLFPVEHPVLLLINSSDKNHPHTVQIQFMSLTLNLSIKQHVFIHQTARAEILNNAPFYLSNSFKIFLTVRKGYHKMFNFW